MNKPMTPPAAFDGAEFRRIAEVVERLESHAVPHIGLREAVSALRHAATLAEELDLARVDAERYEWITEHADGEPARMGASIGIRLLLNRSEETIWMKHVDLGGTDLETAIDDEIAAPKERT